jgi:predicted phage terminase large subunit-like protein
LSENEQDSLLESIALEAEEERRLCEESLYNFVRASWHVLEPSISFSDNWHYRNLCDEIQAAVEMVVERKDRKDNKHLIFNLPPRTYKSNIISVCLTAWVWTKYPGIRFLSASATQRLAEDFAWRGRELINSAWYQDRWGDQYALRGGQNVKSYYATSEKGYRYTTSVGGQCVGFGGDIILIDDPIELEDAMSDQATERCYQWYTSVIENRLNSPAISIVIINHQRFTVNDLTGRLMLNMPNRFRQVSLPAEDTAKVEPPDLKEKYEDGLLFPDRLPKTVLTDRKTAMGSWQYEAQYNQDPKSTEAGLFKRWWWKYWYPAGMTVPPVIIELPDGSVKTCDQVTLPTKFLDIIGSWDMSFKGKSGSDRVAGGVLALADKSNKFLLDLEYGTMGFLDTVVAVYRQYTKWKPKGLTKVLVEDTANGPAVIETLEDRIPILIRVTARASKMARALDASRAASVLAQAEAGHLYLPHPAIANWVSALVEEHASFPHGKYDDLVDMMVHGIRKLSEDEALPGAFGIKV